MQKCVSISNYLKPLHVMKKITLYLIVIVFAAMQTHAQTTEVVAAVKDTSWKIGGVLSANFNQVSLTNWAAGGESTLSFSGLALGFANYKKGKWAWDNGILMGYGMTKIGKDPLIKNDDRLEINTRPGYEIHKNLYISYLFNFRSQFDKGYDYTVEPEILTSEFLSPAFIVNSLGLEYKPNDNFYLYFSPPTIKTTLVNAPNSEIPHLLYGVDSTSNVRNEFGIYFSARYKAEIMKNIKLATKLDLFSNYTEDPQNVDLNWELIITMKVNKYIDVNLGFQAIYDDNVLVPKGIKDGVPAYGKGLQFKQTFGIGLTYSFGQKLVK